MKRIILVVLLLLYGFASPARADKQVHAELQKMAEQVAELLKDKKVIKIGKFTSKGDSPSAYGPAIQHLLAQEFTRLQFKIDGNATVEISGDYRPASKDPGNPANKETFVRINAQLVDTATGEILNDLRILSRAIYGNETLMQVFAPLASIPPMADRQEANDYLRDALKKPQFNKEGARISAKNGSPFAVEVLVVDDKEAANPESGATVEKTSDGLPFVAIKRNQFYRLRIHNNADFDAAVKISIDGLDQYEFSDKPFRKDNGEPKYNYRIVRKGKSLVVSGWFRNLEEFDYFVVTEYAKSASAELKRNPDEAGQIALVFYSCWEQEENRPKDEPPTGGRSATDATGRVPGGKEKNKEINVTVGTYRDVIGIRYGSTKP